MHTLIPFISKRPIYIFLLLLCSQAWAQLGQVPPNTLLGDPVFNESSNAITEDSSGNIYITGATDDYLDTLVAGQNKFGLDAFLAKYDADRNLLWIRQLALSDGGQVVDAPPDDEGFAVTTDSLGNVYMAGGFSRAGISAGDDAFLAKYDGTGQLQWVETFAGIADGNVIPCNQQALGVVADNLGNIYVTGPDKLSAVILKYRDDGTQGTLIASDVIELPGPFGFFETVITNGISIDSIGGIYVAGSTEGFVADNDNPQIDNAGGFDTFLIRYIDQGQNLTRDWARQIGTPQDDFGNAVTASTDLSNNPAIFVAGSSDGGLGNASGTLGGSDAFLIKYDELGDMQWSERFGTLFNDQGFGVAADGSGNVYITGETRGLVDQPTGPPSSDAIDAYVAMYRDNPTQGILQDAEQLQAIGNFSGTIDDIGRGVSASTLGTVLVTGFTSGDDIMGEVSSDAFIVELSAPILGDVNCDGVVDLLDVQPFVDLLTSGGFSDKADINGDGVVDLLDVGPFVDLISG